MQQTGHYALSQDQPEPVMSYLYFDVNGALKIWKIVLRLDFYPQPSVDFDGHKSNTRQSNTYYH